MTKTKTLSSPPPEFRYEFGGPLGTLITILALPPVVLWLAHCSRVGRVDVQCVADVWRSCRNGTKMWDAIRASPVFCPSCNNDTNNNHHDNSTLWYCTAAVVAWFLWQVLLERCLPCHLVQGEVIATPKKKDNGSAPQPPHEPMRLTYRINGHLAFWVTLLVVLTGWPVWDPHSETYQFTSFPYWSWLYEYFAELALVTTLLCFFVNTYLYLDSFRGSKILAAGGNSGHVCYDFFMGRELNPRIGSTTFDWKEFCELRPGLMGWLLLNAASAHQQYVQQGYLTGSMILINLFHGVYIWDALYQEAAILTTMDITTDGFGFMLLFGDLVWVPFTYSLQARYLVHHDPHLSWMALLAIVAVHLVGYTIFRGANGQKNAFRRNPDQVPGQFLQTQRGTKLLTSGWWGLARKINYTGDYIMGFSWCLVCGLDSIVPYYYAIYFLILLVHRSGRDDHLCQAKYGADWDTYKKLVPYRFIPGIV